MQSYYNKLTISHRTTSKINLHNVHNVHNLYNLYNLHNLHNLHNLNNLCILTATNYL
jgi:hypothetical protein